MKSLIQLSKQNLYTNAKIYYKNYNSKIIPWYNIFFYYFIVLNNEIYINDYEFTHVYEFLIDKKNNEHLKNFEIFNYNKFEKVYIEKAVFIKNLYTNAGHSFCNIINSIKKSYDIIDNIEDYKIIITSELKNYNIFLYSSILLFYKKENIIIINENQLIETKTLFMEPDFSKKIKTSVIFLQQKLKLHYTLMNNQKYKKLY